MNVAAQRVCAWCAVPMVALWLVGFWVFAGFVPPPSPQDSAEQVAQMYRDNTSGIRFGLVLTVFGSALLAPFVAVITVQMKRIEGRAAPLAYAQLALGAALPVIFILPIMFLEAASFRADRPAQSVQDLNDVGWLMFIGVVTTAVVELAVIGAAVLMDSRAAPIFPRWYGYYSLWVALLLTPGAVTVFFKHGPLAWNGLFTWWVPLAVFCSWLFITTALLLRAIDRQGREAALAAAVPASDVHAQVAELVDRLIAEHGATAVSAALGSGHRTPAPTRSPR